jgi:hypothetical protein
MRRALVSLMAVMLFAVASSTAIAAAPQTITIRALIAQAGWETYDETTGAGESGDLQFANAEGTTTAYLSMSKGELVLCEGGDTPEDPFDDFYGFVGTETFGEGPAKLSVGKTYSSAKAWGTITADVFTFNECTGEEGATSGKTIKVSLDLTGITPVVHEKLHSTISIPSRLRSKTMIKADSRQAAGTAKLGTRTLQIDGVIGQLSMRASLIER